jgi:hypothetical protein
LSWISAKHPWQAIVNACQRFVRTAPQAYNASMKHAFRPLLAAALAVLPLAAAVAQAQAPAQPASAAAAAEAPVGPGRKNQTIKRIRIEDAGSRIDELRVGGQTEQITVQPKGAGVPPYEVKPAQGAHGAPPEPAGGDTGGSRVWNVLKF